MVDGSFVLMAWILVAFALGAFFVWCFYVDPLKIRVNHLIECCSFEMDWAKKWKTMALNRPRKKISILVCGHGGHGKDTFCEMLLDEFGLSFSSSSWHMREYVWLDMPDYLKSIYESPDEAWRDRENHRELWYKSISRFNSPEKDKLTKAILKEKNIYCGMRDREEFLASKHHFDLCIWVDASKRKTEESRSSNSIDPSMCDVIVDNNGSVEELKKKAIAVMSFFLMPKQL